MDTLKATNKCKLGLILFIIVILGVVCLINFEKSEHHNDDKYLSIDYRRVIKKLGTYKNVKYRKLNKSISDCDIDEEMYRELDLKKFLQETTKDEDKIVSANLYVTDKDGIERFRNYVTYFHVGNSWLGQDFDKKFLENKLKSPQKVDLCFFNNCFKNAKVQLKNVKYFKEIDLVSILSKKENTKLSVDEYKKTLKESSQRRTYELVDVMQENEIFQKVMNNTVFKKIPQLYIDNYMIQMKNHGMSPQNRDAKSVAVETVKENAFRFCAFDDAKIKITDKEYKAFLEKEYEHYKDQFKSASEFEERYSKTMILDNLKKKKINNYILKNAKGEKEIE